eukprot:jgi/Mesvir1/4339/Mv06697-RA.1
MQEERYARSKDVIQKELLQSGRSNNRISAQKDGSVKTLTCKSGRIIRNVLKEEKIELYTTWGKLSNCGGAGNCGTCVVEVVEGADVLSAKTTAELKKLKGKPESWRLACQTNLGDGDNEGKVRT